MKFSIIEQEIFFVTSRSQGAGGQHVNRTNSAVTLRWYFRESQGLSEEEKQIVENKLAARINEDGELYIKREIHRDQAMNRKDAIQTLHQLLAQAFFKPKKRVASKPTKSSVKKRLNTKKIHGQKKKDRSTSWD